MTQLEEIRELAKKIDTGVSEKLARIEVLEKLLMECAIPLEVLAADCPTALSPMMNTAIKAVVLKIRAELPVMAEMAAEREKRL